MKKILSLFLIAAMCASFGCATKELKKHGDDTSGKWQTLHDTARGNDPLNRGLKPFTSRDETFVHADARRLDPGHEKLRKKNIKLSTNGYLADIGDIINRSTGIPVRYAADLGKVDHLKSMQMNVKYNGSLSELLDIVGSYFSIFWEVTEQGQILFYAQKTKTFTVAAFLTDSQISSTISNESDSQSDSSSSGETSGGAAGSSTQTIKSNGSNSPFKEIVESVKNMIGKDDVVTVNRSLSSITVTASPIILEKVEEYIKTVNARYTRQLALNVNIYSFSSNDSVDLGYNLDLIFKNSNVEILGTGALGAVAGAGSFSATILEGGSKNWAGSSGVLQALKANGDVSIIKSVSGLTMNNHPLPIQALERTGYLASSASTLSGDVSEVTLEPGQVVTGLSVLVTPQILPDDRVLLEYSMSYSILNRIDEVTSGNSMIQTPQTDSRTIFQRVTVRPGSTIILAGLTQEMLGQDTSFGVFHTGVNKKDSKEYIVVVMDVSDATLTERR